MLTHIGTIDKLPLSTSGSPLLIRCKNFLSVNFVIPKERECHDVYTTLLKLCQPGECCHFSSKDSVCKFFLFYNSPNSSHKEFVLLPIHIQQ